MSTEKGFVLLYRDLLDNWIWRSNEPFDKRSAWIDLIFRVNYMDKKIEFNGKIDTIERGEIITSLRDLGARWRWSTKKVSGFLNGLEQDGSIVLERNSRFTRIKLVKYSIYQSASNVKETQKKHRGNTEETPRKTTKINNTRNTSNKTLSKDSVEETPTPHGTFLNVFLTDAEKEKLLTVYPKETVDEYIDRVSMFIESSGKEYKSHYAVLLSWMRRDGVRTNKEAERKVLT